MHRFQRFHTRSDAGVITRLVSYDRDDGSMTVTYGSLGDEIIPGANISSRDVSRFLMLWLQSESIIPGWGE